MSEESEGRIGDPAVAQHEGVADRQNEMVAHPGYVRGRNADLPIVGLRHDAESKER